MRLLLIPLAILSFSALAVAQPRPDRPRPPSISVNGEAIIAAAPDQAELDVGVTTQARSAPDAARENAERLARVLAAHSFALAEVTDEPVAG